MNKPVIADKKPAVMELESGTYYWCSCGKSKNQSFCDGSHKGSEFTPVAFEVTEKKPVAVCNCKHTSNPPYCDGSHSKL
ncbi:MAG: CDGSH iron-sulfur domain-containing protein [Rivularia sp. (in: cyanobacteria)]